MPVRILIIDDHFAQRLGLTVAIGSEKDLQVVGQGSSVAEAISLHAHLAPDVTLMDYTLPDGTGLDAANRIRETTPEARIIMLTILDGEEDVFRADKAGVNGYLTKAEDATTLVEAIRTVASGGSYFPAKMITKLKARMKRESLTPRETQILHLIVEGLINKEIGARLGITEGTVKLHVAKVLAKIGAQDRTRAAILAVERGIVKL